MPVATAAQERRKFARSDISARVAVNVLQFRKAIPANSLNLSQGGLCLRLEEALDIRSLIRFQVTPDTTGSTRHQRPVECTGRVAWVMQRLDLRDAAPFLYDVGIEFVNPPAVIRQWLMAHGAPLIAERGRAPRERILEPALIRGRRFVPKIEPDGRSALRWHLVVSVEDVPCFSGHYPSERTAVTAWAEFKRRQARRA